MEAWQTGWASGLEALLEVVQVSIRPMLLLWAVREMIGLFRIATWRE